MPKLSEVAKGSGASIALHVCGKETKLLLEKSQSSIALKLIRFVNRVQINFAYKENQIIQLEDLCCTFPTVNFITQHNEKNKDLFEKIKSKNHQVLFDSSGGRGIKSTLWNEQLVGKSCGYAGGLGLESIEEDFLKIRKVAKNNFWIDMEGRIRTNDLLDLKLCEEILEKLNSIN
ncbi:hypothetical protein GW796_07925 [archaeon]|nr:hypothetical protein [archaeon]